MELKIEHTFIISDLMDEHGISVKDILQRIATKKRTKKGLDVCQFHRDLKDYSIVFTPEWQADAFGLSVNEIECRIKYALNYLYKMPKKAKLNQY